MDPDSHPKAVERVQIRFKFKKDFSEALESENETSYRKHER